MKHDIPPSNLRGSFFKSYLKFQGLGVSQTPIQRVAVTEKYRPVFEKRAKENLSLGGGDKKSPLANLPNPIADQVDTRAELARLAGVGERTYGKATAILNSDNEEVKQKVMSGEKSIDAGYNEIRVKEKAYQSKTRLQENRIYCNDRLNQRCYITTTSKVHKVIL